MFEPVADRRAASVLFDPDRFYAVIFGDARIVWHEQNPNLHFQSF